MSVLYLIALYFAKVRGTMTEEAYTAAVKELHDLPEKTAEVLKVDARMAEIAKKYAKCEMLHHRTWSGLCSRNGILSEAEGNFLYP